MAAPGSLSSDKYSCSIAGASVPNYKLSLDALVLVFNDLAIPYLETRLFSAFRVSFGDQFRTSERELGVAAEVRPGSRFSSLRDRERVAYVAHEPGCARSLDPVPVPVRL